MSHNPINEHDIVVAPVVEFPQPRKFLRIKDAANALGCSTAHIRKLIRNGEVKTCRPFGLLRISVEDWNDAVERSLQEEEKSK